MTEKISIRNAKFAKQGLTDLIEFAGIDFNNFTMAEIGSYSGDSTEIFAKACNEIYCIDPWQNGYDPLDAASHLYPMHLVEKQFDSLMELYPNIQKFKMKSDVAVKLFNDEYFDFVYVDGNHSYESVKEDIKAWLPKIKSNGWIAGHDYKNRHHPLVEKAVNETIGIPDQTFRDTSWLKKV